MRPAAKILKAGAAVCLLSAAVFLASGGAALPFPHVRLHSLAWLALIPFQLS